MSQIFFQSLIWRMLSRVKPILYHPLPMTFKTTERIILLGTTGYWHIWILGYGEIAQPLMRAWTIPQRRDWSWAPKNWCFWTVVLQKTLESPLDCKEIQPVHSKDQSWVFIGRTDAKAETPILWPPHAELTHWKRLWCWEGLGVGGEGDDGRWDGWMASPTQWTWVWVDFGSWWWTGRPGMLQFMGLQGVGHDWVTELNWGWS